MPHSISHPLALEGRTLLDELNHRIKNELGSVINLVSFKAIWTDNVEVKEELSNVVDLLHQHVEVHSILTIRIATRSSTPANSFASLAWP